MLVVGQPQSIIGVEKNKGYYVKEHSVRSFRKGHNLRLSGACLLRPIRFSLTELSKNQWNKHMAIVLNAIQIYTFSVISACSIKIIA